jgi:hypothetical protein
MGITAKRAVFDVLSHATVLAEQNDEHGDADRQENAVAKETAFLEREGVAAPVRAWEFGDG